jgi:hypothetical protein
MSARFVLKPNRFLYSYRKSGGSLRHTLLLIAALAFSAEDTFAQAPDRAFTAGFAVPFDHHDVGSESASDSNFVNQTVWAEISFPWVRKASLTTRAEIPLRNFESVRVHPGTRGSVTDVRRISSPVIHESASHCIRGRCGGIWPRTRVL